MAKQKIQLQDGIKRVVWVDPDATEGAVVGVNLRLPDGTILTPSQIINPPPVEDTGDDFAPALWSLILEVPKNVREVEELATEGIVVRGAGSEWHTTALQPPAQGIDIINPDGVAGPPTFELVDDLEAVEELTTTGLAARTADSTWATRQIVAPAAGITVTNPDGVAGDPTVALANDLAAVEGLSTSGLAVRVSPDTWATRTITGAHSIVASNGDGVAGEPTLNLVNDVTSPGNLYSYGTNESGVKGWGRPAVFESTGLSSGGLLSINANPQLGDIAPATLVFADYSASSTKPARSIVSFPGVTGLTIPNRTTSVANYVGIDSSLTIHHKTSPFTNTERRTIVQLGAFISNLTNIITVNQLPSIVQAGINQLADLYNTFGKINRSGNVVGPNGANLLINKSAGVMTGYGLNFHNNPNDPHDLPLASLTAPVVQYRLSTGTAYNLSGIDPDNYETPLGTLAAMPNNRYSVQYISVFPSNLIRIQYGQTVYQTIEEAAAGVTVDPFTTEANIAENGMLLCFLIVKKGTTDLTDNALARFVPASKFGGPVGSGGLTLTSTDALTEGVANLYFTNERVDDRVASLLVAGTNITLSYNDTAGTLTIDSAGGGTGLSHSQAMSRVSLRF